MAVQTSSTYETTEIGAAQQHIPIAGSLLRILWNAMKVLIGIVLIMIVVLILGQLIKSAPSVLGSSANVDESLTDTIADFLIYIAPFAAYATCSRTARSQDRTRPGRQLAVALAAVIITYAVVSIGQRVFEVGPYSEKPSFGVTLSKVENGARVESMAEAGVARQAGVKVGDIIVGIRRAELTYEEIQEALSEAGYDDVVRLRIMRDGEEVQLPLSPGPTIDVTLSGIVTRLGIALLFTVAAFYWRGRLTPICPADPVPAPAAVRLLLAVHLHDFPAHRRAGARSIWAGILAVSRSITGDLSPRAKTIF